MILTAYIWYKNTYNVILANVNPVSPWVEQREAHNNAFQNLKQKSQAKNFEHFYKKSKEIKRYFFRRCNTFIYKYACAKSHNNLFF